jgi:hypothetical protein
MSVINPLHGIRNAQLAAENQLIIAQNALKET